MRSERRIRKEYDIMRGLAESAPRNSDSKREWTIRAEQLAWVLEEDDVAD